MGRLILNLLRRMKWFYGLSVLFSPVPALGTGLMMGIWVGSSLTISREILQLPVSRKEIWRMRWILALLPVVIGLFGQWARLGIVTMAGGKAEFSAGWPLLIFLFQLSALGMGAFVSGPMGPYIVKYLRPAKRLGVLVLPFIAATAAELVLAAQSFREMRQWPGDGLILLLMAGLFVGAISFFHSPETAPRLVLNLSPRESQGIRQTRSLTKPWTTGLTFFAWTQLRGIVFAAILSGIASQLPMLLEWWFGVSTSILDRLSLFSGQVPLGAVFLFAPIVMATGWIVLGPDLLGLRQLRMLPISTRALAAVLTLAPILFWLSFWVFPVAAHWMVFGHRPPSLRLELLSGLTGLTCLVGAAVLLRSVVAPIRIFLLPLCIAAGFGVLHLCGAPLKPETAGFIGILGLAAIAASFVLNARALHQSSVIYKSVLWRPAVSPLRWISG